MSRIGKYCQLCYNFRVATPRQARKGGSVMETASLFFLSVMASVVAYYICKWLDRRVFGNEPSVVN